MKMLDKMFGENWKEEKQEYRQLKKRIDALPQDFQTTYKAIEKYCYTTGIIESEWKKFEELIDLFEITSFDGNTAHEVVGSDVAEFCDEFFDHEDSNYRWLNKQRQKLNDYFAVNHR